MSEWRPCIIIPVYNHSEGIQRMAPKLADLDIPCFLINDGSDDETTAVLDELSSRHDGFNVVHRIKNGGKGAAVCDGFAEALKAGFTHGVQIDADGQHTISDIPVFLDVAKANPATVVVGNPVFDKSIPRHRFYFRYLTHVCVWVECLSKAIQDSMCGFRVFPLQATQQVVEKVHIGKRMDFDTEILVRLYWQGMAIRNVKTKVIYHPDGVSHFNLVKDNVRITLMHTRLLFGMLFAMPRLLLRRKMKRDKEHWSKREERGAYFLLRFILFLYKCGGKWLCRLLVYPIVFYFFLTGSRARKGSMKFLTRLYEFDSGRSGFKKPPGYWHVFLHMLSFGKSLLERMGAWMGEIGRWDLEWENRWQLIEKLEQKEGVVLMGGHVGTLEVIRAVISDHPEMTYNALVYTEHASRINQLFKLVNPNTSMNVISVKDFNLDTAISLKERMDAGEFVVIMGDRVPVGAPDRHLRASFLGHDAPFPVGPFILASLLDCPVFYLYCLRRPDANPEVILDPVEEKALKFPRENREAHIKKAIQHYSHRLEDLCYKAPYQWFNFYDFWDDEDIQ